MRRIQAGVEFVAPVDGWFVPDARWQDLRRALADKIAEAEKDKK